MHETCVCGAVIYGTPSSGARVPVWSAVCAWGRRAGWTAASRSSSHMHSIVSFVSSRRACPSASVGPSCVSKDGRSVRPNRESIRAVAAREWKRMFASPGQLTSPPVRGWRVGVGEWGGLVASCRVGGLSEWCTDDVLAISFHTPDRRSRGASAGTSTSAGLSSFGVRPLLSVALPKDEGREARGQPGREMRRRRRQSKRYHSARRHGAW